MQAQYISRTPENDSGTIASFFFKPAQKYRFTAGQYADITIPHPHPDNRGQTRTMTFSSSPSSDLLRITTRVGNEDMSSYKQALLKLKKGDQVGITDAMGDMILPLDADIPLIFVAGGVGIASYAGIFEWLIERQERRTISLFYAVRNPEDIIFQEQIAAYQSITPLLQAMYTSRGDVPLSLKSAVCPARLTTDKIAASIQDNSQIYLSGTEHMVEQFRRELQQQYGVAHYRIVFDYFDGYTDTI